MSSHHGNNRYAGAEGALPYPIQVAYENGRGNHIFCIDSYYPGNMAIFLLKEFRVVNAVQTIKILYWLE